MNNQRESNAAAQATSAAPVQPVAGESGGGGQAPVPYDRFAEVVAERNDLRKAKGEWEALQKTHVETNAGLQKALESERRRNVAVRAAIRAGLPLELADRLQGDSEEAIGEDAAGLARLLAGNGGGIPPPVGGTPQRWDVGNMSAAQVREHEDEILRSRGMR